MAEKVEELNKVTAPEPGGNVDASGVVPVENTGSAIAYRDKAQIISELKAKGVAFDARASKDKLEELLKV